MGGFSFEEQELAPRPQRPCRATGCNALHRNANGYCHEHAALAKQWSHQKEGKGNTTERGYGWHWQRLRKQVLRRDGYLCQCEKCEKRVMPLVAHEVDHIIPKAEGGTDAPENLRAISKSCHRRKTLEEAKGARRSRSVGQ